MSGVGLVGWYASRSAADAARGQHGQRGQMDRTDSEAGQAGLGPMAGKLGSWGAGDATVTCGAVLVLVQPGARESTRESRKQDVSNREYPGGGRRAWTEGTRIEGVGGWTRVARPMAHKHVPPVSQRRTPHATRRLRAPVTPRCSPQPPALPITARDSGVASIAADSCARAPGGCCGGPDGKHTEITRK